MTKQNTWTCGAGSFRSVEQDGCIQLTGIRYAVSKRFEAPEPYVYPAGVHTCDRRAPFAPQIIAKGKSFHTGQEREQVYQEESCQYLSITLPADAAPGRRLPVMVWVHGGSYLTGGCDHVSSCRIPLSRENGVIVLGINYRLGVFGFVRDRAGQYANLGLLDVIEGLRWVKRNIAAFGGDAENITLFGQSAGGDLVRCVMLSEGTERLYRRAIIQSDPMGAMEGRERMERRILEQVNRLPADAPTQALLELQAQLTSRPQTLGAARYLVIAPHFGVYPLPKREDIPARLREIAPDHPLLIGCTAREAASFLAGRPLRMWAHRFLLTKGLLTARLRSKTETIFIRPSDAFARAYAEAGGRTYRYLFTWTENGSLLGACHSMDHLPLFGFYGAPGAPITMGLSAEEIYQKGIPMRRIWGGFAKSGRVSEWRVAGMLEIEELTRAQGDRSGTGPKS